MNETTAHAARSDRGETPKQMSWFSQNRKTDEDETDEDEMERTKRTNKLTISGLQHSGMAAEAVILCVLSVHAFLFDVDCAY